jgi:dTDP-4-dehydrorhamnose reductase
MSTQPTNIGPVLIIGGSGMLGRATRELLTRTGTRFDAPGHAELDITNPAHLERWITRDYKLVVNCSAWTDVDGAETNEPAATQLNGHAVAGLALRCKAADSLLVHYSTDYVFEGAGTPIPTDAPHMPVNAYGRSKAVGEQLLHEQDPEAGHYLLIRTSWLYAPWSKNFVRTIAKAARERPTLKVVNDQFGRPTSAEHLADATFRLVSLGEERFDYVSDKAPGAWHITDAGQCSWFDFAVRIAAFANPACRVEPCGSDAFPRPARRPAYSVMDITRSESAIGFFPTWEQNLDDVLRRLE